MNKSRIVPVESIAQRILIVRGQRVVLDADLAQLYQVKTKALNQAVRRNSEKFPGDFMFQLTRVETRTVALNHVVSTRRGNNRSQIVTGSQKHRDPRSLPYAFAEHGAIMAANVLKSERAVRMSVYVVRAFVRLRDLLATHKEVVRKLVDLERRIGQHDADIQAIVEAIRQLMKPPDKSRRQIGFRVEESRTRYQTRA